MSEQFHPSENVDTAALAAERTAALEAAQTERADLQTEISPEQIRSAEITAFIAENYPNCPDPSAGAEACLAHEANMSFIPGYDITTDIRTLETTLATITDKEISAVSQIEATAQASLAVAEVVGRNDDAAQVIAVNARVNPDSPLAIPAERSIESVLSTPEANAETLVVLASVQADVDADLATKESAAQLELSNVEAEVATESARAENNKERLNGAEKLQADYNTLRQERNMSQKDALQELLRTSENPEHKDRIAQILGNISTLENALPGKSEAVARFIESSNLDLGAANQAQVFADVFTNMEASGEFTAEEVETLRAAVGAGEAEIKTGSDINNALEDGAGTDEAGNRIPYTAENPLEPRPNTKIYEEPGGERTVEINVGGDIIKTRVGADILGNDMGKVVNTMLVLQVAETMGLNNVFFQKGFNQLGGGAPIRIDYDDIDDAQQVMTAFLGGGTGFNGDVMAENETERLEKNFQWLRRGEVSGDGGTDDNDSGKAIADLQTLGILDAGGALDTNKLAAAGQFIQLNAGTSTSRFEQLRTFLQGGESTTVAGTMV